MLSLHVFISPRAHFENIETSAPFKIKENKNAFKNLKNYLIRQIPLLKRLITFVCKFLTITLIRLRFLNEHDIIKMVQHNFKRLLKTLLRIKF